ncbi:MAG: DUF4886 domain-containing protein, partial [Spirochaetia bacterium]|nr:DUF4886 domain-containing protein [Spirochaetia bacterium]
ESSSAEDSFTPSAFDATMKGARFAMRRFHSLTISGVLGVVLFLFHGFLFPGLEAKTVRLLMIGNSFSMNTTQFLSNLAKAGGHEIQARVAYIPGGTLQQHWEKWQTWKADEKNPKGKYSSGLTLHDYLTNAAWDVITFQQGSASSHDSNTYFPYLENLYEVVKSEAPRASLAIYESWAYRAEHKSYSNWGFGPGEMYLRLSNAYRLAAARMKLPLIKTGDAFYLAENNPAWPRRLDPSWDSKTAVYPRLPNESGSLYAGWIWRVTNQSPRLTYDVQHAGVAGCFLASCVMYEYLLNESVLEVSYIPPASKDVNGNVYAANAILTESDLKFLKSVAHQVGELVAK